MENAGRMRGQNNERERERERQEDYTAYGESKSQTGQQQTDQSERYPEAREKA
jgi:hypothetical protein